MENKGAYNFNSEDAENYDYYLGPIMFEPYARYLASQIDATNVSAVLELACGTGRVTRQIRKALPDNVTLWATDISGDMLDIARREIVNDSINFAVEDAQNLSFADNSFDLVICQFGMMFLPDKKKGFNEIFRVLKPGGKFTFATWDDTSNMPLFKLLIDDLILPHFQNEDNTRFKVPFSMHNPLSLTDLMKSAGFKNAESHRILLKPNAPSIEHVVTGLFRKHCLGGEIMGKDPAAFESVAIKFEQEIANKFGVENPAIPLSAFFTTGSK